MSIALLPQHGGGATPVERALSRPVTVGVRGDRRAEASRQRVDCAGWTALSAVTQATAARTAMLLWTRFEKEPTNRFV